MSSDTQGLPYVDGKYTSHDGLKLYWRHYPAKGHDEPPAHRPILCLPGLTRNSNDFHVLAMHLCNSPNSPRDVYCIDYRGRGRSDYDPKWQNYSPYIEMLDVLDFLTVADLHEPIICGTSRGGIIAFLMAVTRPSSMGAVILNDIGPVIESRGLARIMGYAGKTPEPDSWEDAALIVKDMSGRFFTDIKDEEWLEIARQWYMEEDGRPVQGYDLKLANALSEIDLSQPIPQMWEHLEALSHVPVMVLRGANSDLLSQDTVDKMAVRHPRLSTYLVEEEGHAPLLRDKRTLRAIDDFLENAALDEQAKV